MDSVMETSTRRILRFRHKDQINYLTGLILAIMSCLFIGTSFIIKKLSLRRLTRKGSLRAGAGGFGYLRDWMWWLGFITMGVGELLNFTAYTFAPASLVTPLGALSVLVSAVLASRFLKEGLNALGKIGCLLCILGSIMIIIHSPKEQGVTSMTDLLEKLHDTVFINYVFFVILVTLLIIFYLGPRYGNRHVMVYITLCSAVGSLTVMACKGLGLAIKEVLSGDTSDDDLNKWLAYTFFTIVVVCIFLQMNYLNKALDLFNTSIVTPVYYVTFTTLVITASAILFKEWRKMGIQDILGTICGFFVVIVAIFLLQGFRDYDSLRINNSRQRQSLIRHSSRDYGSGSFSQRTV